MKPSRSATDITGQKAMEEKMVLLAHYDEATGFPNRLTFKDRLEQALIRARNNGRQVGVLALHSDALSGIGDRCGRELLLRSRDGIDGRRLVDGAIGPDLPSVRVRPDVDLRSRGKWNGSHHPGGEY